MGGRRRGAAKEETESSSGLKHRLITLGHICALESDWNPGAITLFLHHCKRMMREAQRAQEIIEYPMRILMRKNWPCT
jgi:hypothetical protein